MNGIKKVLLVVIALEGLVLLPLLAIKVWDPSPKKVREQFVAHKVTCTPKAIVKQSISKDKEKVLQQSLKRGISEFKEFLNSQNSLTFLYSQEIHKKKREAIETYSKNFLGIPYVWGATGPKSFDCSGFTQKVYAKWGIKLPRHSTRQAQVGEYVTYEDLERGDMVFFDTERKATGVVNHVGIYLEEGKFIHASSGNKKVVITDFNEKPFYKNRFLWGRRVVKDTIFKPLPSFSKTGLEYLMASLESEEKKSKFQKVNANTLALLSLD